MNLTLFGLLLASTNSFAQTLIDSGPGLEVNGPWLRGYKTTPYPNHPRQSIEIAPSPEAFNALVGRVAVLEGRANATDACIATEKEAAAERFNIEGTVRVKNIADLRAELCKSVEQLQSAVCQDPIFIERLEAFVEKKVTEIQKSDRERLKDELKAEITAELKKK